MSRKISMLATAVLFLGCMAWAAEKSWVGVVSDNHCNAKHAMASDQAAACVKGCVGKGCKYVLVSHGKVYQVDPQDKFADFAGKRVKVSGSMSGETITASAVAAAPAPKAAAKKAKAKKAAGM